MIPVAVAVAYAEVRNVGVRSCAKNLPSAGSDALAMIAPVPFPMIVYTNRGAHSEHAHAHGHTGRLVYSWMKISTFHARFHASSNGPRAW